jgi:hypothetical protein
VSEQAVEAPPQMKARLAGAAYLLVIIAALFAELFVRGGLVVPGDAAEAASNILANETRWRLGFAADVVAATAYVAVSFLLYGLLRVVSRTLSLGAAIFGVLGSGVMAVNLLNLFAPLVILGDGGLASAFSPDQTAALARSALRLHGLGYSLSLVFFGLQLILLGYLILRSRFLPRVLGVLLPIAGLFGVVRGFAVFIAPTLASDLYLYAMASSLIAEGGLTLWLLVMGVNAQRWREQARAGFAAGA